jgi:hypothetical protein
VLPRSEEKSERAVIAAEWGTGVHKWKETGEFPEGRNGTTLRKKVKEAGVERDTYWVGGLHEVPLAYNVVTQEARALVLPLPLDKKDAWKGSFDDTWVTGTADYVGLLFDAPWVDDLKTGRRVDYLDYRYQQGFYALAWTLFQTGGLGEVRSTITHWPKYPIPNKPRRFGTVLEPDFFLELQGRLKQLREDVMKLRELEASGRRDDVVARLTDGPQCVYCPSKLACTKGLKYE